MPLGPRAARRDVQGGLVTRTAAVVCSAAVVSIAMTGERIAAITRAIDARDRRDDRGFRRQVTQTRPGAASMALHPCSRSDSKGRAPFRRRRTVATCRAPDRRAAMRRSAP
jgi:hypothetical protein